MKHFLLLAICITISSLVGCKKEAPDAQINVEKDFILEMRENLSPGGNTLQFLAETTAAQECLHTGILLDLQKNTHRINLSFLELTEPAECLPGTEPAQGSVPAGDLTMRDYTFQIDLRGELESTGVLNVLEDRYVVSFSRQIGFEFSENILLKVRPNMIWGYVNHSESETNNAREFTTALREISDEIDPEPGNYGWFTTTENGITAVADMPTERENILFLFTYSGSDEAIENLLAQYRTDFPETDFNLFDYQGKSF